MTMRLLVANFFPAFFPPTSGGEQRYYSLYRHLSERHDVTLVSATYSDRPEEFVEHSPSFREYRVPKPPQSEQVHWDLYRAGIGDECSGFVVALSSGIEDALRRRFRELLRYADVVVHESPFTFPLDETAYRDGKPRVYASYNIEHRLAAQMLRGESGRAATRFIRYLEGLLVRRSDLVFATSDEERDAFVADFDCDPAKLRIAPNGFEPHADRPADDAGAPPAERIPYAVFLGSNHPPNVEAGRYICETLAPLVPGVEFRIMGSVCRQLEGAAPSNVALLGFVEESVMLRQIAGCRAALNPLFSGAGTNLKMLQYMEAGAPILTTAVGARGLDLVAGTEAIVQDAPRFAVELERLVREPELRRRLGEAARKKAYERYTWAQIAERFAKELEPLRPPEQSPSRPRILAVNDFPVDACASGGEARIFHLVRELAVDFDVDLLCLTDEPKGSEVRMREHALQRSIPRTDEHRAAARALDHRQAVSVRDIAAADWIVRNEEFMVAFRAALPHTSLVVFEHPYLAPLLEYVPAHIPVVYSSLNVEQELKRSLLNRRADGKRWLERVRLLEDELVSRAQAVVAVSDHDAAAFRALYPGVRVIVVKNGVTIATMPRDAGPGRREERASAVFLGSAHPPNIDAARFILGELAARLPEVDFHILGSVCEAVEGLRRPRNVILHGRVNEATKIALLRSSTIAINPMSEGGGSSLKVPDFLAAALPLVSTRLGVRGFDLRPGEHYIEAERDDFAAQLEHVAGDPQLRARLGRAGRRSILGLGWPVLGARYRRFLRRIIRKKPGGERRLLVVTYRLMVPAPGGAESYMNHLLRHLEAPGLTVDVAACDVGTIENQWHFSARYGARSAPQPVPPGVEQVLRFPVEPLAPDTFAKCRTLFAAWMDESRRQWEGLFERIGETTLLGGWNFPERSGGLPWRWTSLRAQIGVVQPAQAIRIEGMSPRRQRLKLRTASGVAADQVVEGAFVVEAKIAPERQVLEIGVEAAHAAEGDPRELGVAVVRIALGGAEGLADLDLRVDGEALLRKADTDAWVESLVTVTQERAEEIDEMFFQARGPSSHAMRAWLERYVGDYDAVLVQGTPFAPLRWASRIAAQRGVPVALLPHFHVEDRYYHWKGYYDAFRNADCVLAFPPSIKPQFFDRIDARAELVAGGGIELEEYEPERLQACAMRFAAVHASDRPFVLVLGRKAGGKLYSVVLEAALGKERAFEVVMIGPDDDGQPVDQPGVHYYGARPRDFVLGALAQCACLVNMSESESFGIVLLEAWAAGRPVVAQRRCVAFRDLVEEGVNGFLAETPEEIAARVEAYLADPSLAARHAEAGRETARRHSWASLGEHVRAILDEHVFAVPAEAAGP